MDERTEQQPENMAGSGSTLSAWLGRDELARMIHGCVDPATGYTDPYAAADAVLRTVLPGVERLRDALRDAERLMNHMGDVLNGMDAVTDEDVEMATPIFEKVCAALD